MRLFSVIALVGLAALSLSAFAAAPSAEKAKPAFTLPALPYAVNDLAPVIDDETMNIHHGKHHQAYVDNLNKAVAETPALHGKSLDEILAAISTYSPAVRNNAGGHWNHSFFWPLMTKQRSSGEPSDALTKALSDSFGSVTEFKLKFEAAGLSRFGAGWVWLIVTPEGKLEITSTPYQDNPLMDDAPVKGTPILGNDVWEHAYYLQYQNRRGEYLSNWWSVVNWKQVAKHYDDALATLAKAAPETSVPVTE